MPDIYEIAEAHRRALLAAERQAASAMVQAYGQAWQRIRTQLDDLLYRIAGARAAGQEVGTGWLFQAERLSILQQQVEAEIRQFARYAEQSIITQQAEAVRVAQEHAQQLTLTGLGEPPPGVLVTFARLPTGALTDLVGFLQDGSPLRELLDELGPEASQAVRKALITGVATGQGPRTIARWIRQELGGNLARALTISRTEVLRSYRTASLRTYQANRDVVKGWIWHSARDRRTCMACIAMHGSFHTLEERLDDHVRGRCSMVPVTKTWAELGYRDIPDRRPPIEPGPEWFARQPEAVQRQMLGPARYAAWKDGAFDLRDLVGRRRNPRWGSMRPTFR